MAVAAAGPRTGTRWPSGLWHRQLDTYPATSRRMTYLAITVVATIALYYERYVGGSVSPLSLQKFHMSFTFFVYSLALSNLLGAFGSLFAGLTDRVGRTNLVVVGLVITGVFTAVVIPAASTKWWFVVLSWAVGIIEGICLVATPALIRDFSPQMGRASAMGFWTSGPVVGSLVVSAVATGTLGSNPSPAFWVHEYHICGIVGLVVALIALVGLKELSPGLRDQLMVSMRDRALIEARARGLDIEESLRHPWRQLLKVDVVVSALGISVFLLVYYTAVGFGLIYFETVFGFSAHTGNALGNWTWGADVVAVVLFGFISDALKVRKPFMVAGGVLAGASLILYLERAGHPTSFTHLALLVSLLSFFLGVAYVPWMASFTETVEARNPALTATGLAIWGWLLRLVVFGSYMLLPTVVHAVTPLVQDGPEVSAIIAQYPGFQVPASTLAVLEKDPTNATALAQAHAVLGPNYINDLLALKKAPASDVAYLTAHAPAVVKAKTDAPGQWKNWYWICFGGIVVFLATVPLMRGRWSAGAARADEEAHEAMVRAEMEKLGIPA